MEEIGTIEPSNLWYCYHLIFRSIFDSILYYVAHWRHTAVLFGTQSWSTFKTWSYTHMEKSIAMGFWSWLCNVHSFVFIELFLQCCYCMVSVLSVYIICKSAAVSWMPKVSLTIFNLHWTLFVPCVFIPFWPLNLIHLERERQK